MKFRPANSPLAAPELAPLIARLRQRIERGLPLTGSITLISLAPSQREAIHTLLGRPPAATNSTHNTTLSLDELSVLLVDSHIAPDLRAAVEQITGPLENKPAARANIEAEWNELFASAHAPLRDTPALAPLLGQLQNTGLLKRLARSNPATARTLLEQLARITLALPAHGAPLAAFAAAQLGDAHALDSGTPLSNLVLRACASIAAIEYPETPDAETRRHLWASAGILCDELSTPALVLNLPVSKKEIHDTPFARLLDTARAAGEPLPVTLRMLLRNPLSQNPALSGLDVRVCENPTILSLAADRLGPLCAPLVCVGGQYATPAKILLRQLEAAGARLHYHGDFDAGGLAIARRIFAEYPTARPWRMTAADYLAAPKGKPIANVVTLSSPWAPALAEAMREHKRAVHEEAIFDQLFDDLKTQSQSPGSC